MRKFTPPSIFLFLLILFILSFNFSCRKEYIHAPVTVDSLSQSQTNAVSNQFFNTHLPADENLIAIRNNILKQNQRKAFIDQFVKFAGYPIWDKAITKIGGTNTSTANKSLKETNNSKVIFIPLALDTQQRVNAILQVKVSGNDTSFQVLYKWQYNVNGYKDNTKFNSASQIALMFMGLESFTFDHEDFKLNDTLLLRGKRVSDTIHIKSFNDDVSERVALLQQVKVHICYTVSCTPLTRNQAYIQPTPCQQCADFYEWVDDGTGSGSSGGGGTSGGGDNGGGDDGGWQNDPCDPSGGSTGPSTRVGQLAPCDGGGSGDDPWLPVLPHDPVVQFDPNYPFANIDNPIDVPDDPLISSSVSITDNITNDDPIETPRTIAHTQNRNNTEDMLSETNGDVTGINSSELQKTDNGLFSDMSSLFYWCTYFDNDLRNVGNSMIQKFKDKTGGTYENDILDQKVASSSSLHNFIINFVNILENTLESAGGNIDNIENIDLGEMRPKFNGEYNKFHGLQILINDTEYTEIELDGFRVSSDGKRTAIITLIIHDHFGLDKNDALSYQDEPIVGDGFAAWWILQHKMAYKPFETIIKVRKKLEWTP